LGNISYKHRFEPDLNLHTGGLQHGALTTAIKCPNSASEENEPWHKMHLTKLISTGNYE